MGDRDDLFPKAHDIMYILNKPAENLILSNLNIREPFGSMPIVHLDFMK